MVSKFQDLKDFVLKKLHKKRGDADMLDGGGGDKDGGKDAPLEGEMSNKKIAATSMLDGDHGKIFGVSRPIVVGIGIFFFVVFALAFIFASDDSSDKKASDPNQKTEDKIAKNKNGATNSKSLPNDYEQLAKETHQNQAKPGQPSGQPSRTAGGAIQAQRQSSVEPASAPASVPAISSVPRASIVGSYSQPYTLPSQAAPLPSIPATPVTSESAGTQQPASAPAAPATITDRATAAAKSLEDSMKSAISFALGGGDGGTSDGDTASADASATSVSSSTPAASSVTYTPADENTLTAGTVIPAMLLTGINTDAPGQVAAQVLSDVYDYTGTNLLVPSGSQVLGTVSGTDGSSGRVSVTFNTLVTPNGDSWNVGSSFQAIDGEGYSGIVGHVHHHTARNLGAGILKSALSALSTINVDRVTLDASAITDRFDDSYKPTTTIDPGYQFNVYVTNSIHF